MPSIEVRPAFRPKAATPFTAWGRAAFALGCLLAACTGSRPSPSMQPASPVDTAGYERVEASPPSASNAAFPPPLPEAPAHIRLPHGIEVDRARGEVTIPATVGTTSGWLEQVACLAGTRDHEALLLVEARPSEVHAALLLLGLEPGAPGSWQYDPSGVTASAPRGPDVEVLVRWMDEAGPREVAAVDWIRGADGRSFPAAWVFAGSRIDPNPPSFGPGEHYVADFTGSLVGLVTFGDETIAALAVFADQIEIEAANWEAWTERMLPEGTAVTLVLRREGSGSPLGVEAVP